MIASLRSQSIGHSDPWSAVTRVTVQAGERLLCVDSSKSPVRVSREETSPSDERAPAGFTCVHVNKCDSPSTAARGPPFEVLRVQVSNSRSNEGSEAQKIHIFHHDLPRTRGSLTRSTYCKVQAYKDYQRTSSTLLSDHWPHVRVAYISSSISSKINTFTAPDRLRLVRRSLTREPELWR